MNIKVLLPNNPNWVANNNPVAIVDHHAEAETCSVLDINRWHLDRGWNGGCGYQYLVRKDGTIEKGRPDNVIGAHCPGFNSNSIGICHEGNFMVDEMTDTQFNASVELHKYLIGKNPNIKNIYEHGEVYPTSCAGSKFPFARLKKAVSGDTTPVVPQADLKNRTWLQVGDSGDKVKELQTKLEKLGYNCGGTDGSFGKNTKNAVYRFQQDEKICADGLVGDETWKMLNAALVSISNSPSTPKNNNTLELQQKLNKLNFISKLTEDGEYGPATTNTVRAFQSIAGISIDGVAGSETLTSIDYILSKPLCSIKVITPIPTRYIQFRLGVKVDGSFGPNTSNAVKNFQKAKGLSADGCVGPITWSKFLA